MSQDNCFVFVRVEYCTNWHRRWVGRAVLPFNVEKCEFFNMDCRIEAMVECDLRQRGIILPDIANVKLQIIFLDSDDDMLSLVTDGVSEVTPGLRMFWSEVKPVSDAVDLQASNSTI